MLSAYRAWNTRLLATQKVRGCTKTFRRYRSKKSLRGTLNKSARTLLASVRRSGQDDSARKIEPTFRDANSREWFTRNEAFKPWLITQLQAIDKTSSDPGYVTFARNLAAVLRNKSIQLIPDAPDTAVPPNTAWQPSEQSKPFSLLKSLATAYHSHGEAGVHTQLRYSYHGLVASRKFSRIDIEDQEKLADLRYPVEWYPATRAVQRKIILHVGPTNSGKTYHALKRLEQAKSGIYAGPLRLLAHEVYTRLNSSGRTCDLVTGDERAAHAGAELQSCTVEMVPLNVDVDVAVIDEIQMIGNTDRGWAWTQALLGLKAKEIHLCGEERSVPLVRELAASMGDEIEIHTYKRLSPLKTMSASLNGRLEKLRKGDCVVVFSRVGIHTMKKDIERITQKRVAIVYGALPPEIRAQQARLFNDPDNDYDILVASDAIGMGLNLAIKRIIFESVVKFNGLKLQKLENAQLKQIAGRAGRYRTAFQENRRVGNLDNETPMQRPLETAGSPAVGLVTTLMGEDLPALRKAMQSELDPIMSAGIMPPTTILSKFATYFPPSTSFSYILLRLHELSLQHPRYHLCDLKEQTLIADVIQPVRNLSTHDRIIFCAAPARTKEHGMRTIVEAFARCIGDRSSGALLDIPQLDLEILDEKAEVDRLYMDRLESLHKSLVLYLWLSYRFAGVFIDQAMAFYVKGLVEEKIDKILVEYSASPAIREKIRRLREEAVRQISGLDEPVGEKEDSSIRGEFQGNDLLLEDEPAFTQNIAVGAS